MSDHDKKKERTIPVVEEQLQVEKQREETGRVRVDKVVHEREEVIDEPLLETEVEVRRIPVGQFVDDVDSPRQRGDTTVIPVYEEVLVTEKKLRLREEIHITPRESERRQPETVHLRTEEAIITERDESTDN